MAEALRTGDEQKCPRCGRWHVLERRNTTGTDNERAMLYVTCRGALYYAGAEGSPSRWPTRAKL
jgi:hypothetical protein